MYKIQDKKKLQPPLVSIVITTRNRSNLLIRSIKSAINQTYKNIEIIVVDDCSDDDTDRLVENFMKKEANIRYFRNQKQSGANFSRNVGILNAKGEFITGLDDDDEFLPKRVEKLIKNYDASYAFVTSQNRVVRSNGTFFIYGKSGVVTLSEMYSKNIIGNQALVEKKRLIETGLYDENLSACQDYDMWIRLMQRYGNVKVLPECLQIIHEDDNITRISTKSKNKQKGYWSFYKKYKKYMGKKDKQQHLFLNYKIREKEISIKSALTLINSENSFKVLEYLAKSGKIGYSVIISFYNFMEQLDKNKKYILYGYGSIGKIVVSFLGKERFEAVIDKSIKTDIIDGLKVISIKQLSKYQNCDILVTPYIYKKEILNELGDIKNNIININLL